MIFNIPKGMLMGVATASMQIEGNKLDSNWYDWYRRGFIGSEMYIIEEENTHDES